MKSKTLDLVVAAMFGLPSAGALAGQQLGTSPVGAGGRDWRAAPHGNVVAAPYRLAMAAARYVVEEGAGGADKLSFESVPPEVEGGLRSVVHLSAGRDGDPISELAYL